MKTKITKSKNGYFYSAAKENELYWIFSHGKPIYVGDKGHYSLANGCAGIFWSKDKKLVKRLFNEIINSPHIIKITREEVF